jgi:hypothetical protein
MVHVARKSPCHILSIGFPGRCDPTRSFRERVEAGLIYQTQSYHDCHREFNQMTKAIRCYRWLCIQHPENSEISGTVCTNVHTFRRPRK